MKNVVIKMVVLKWYVDSRTLVRGVLSNNTHLRSGVGGGGGEMETSYIIDTYIKMNLK